MTSEQRLEDMRQLSLTAPEGVQVRLLVLFFSLILLATVLWLVRHRVLREEYTPIWVGTAISIFLVSARFEFLRGIAFVLGAWTVSSAVFALAIMFLVGICLSYAVKLSSLDIKTKNLAQEVALLRSLVDQRLHASSVDAGTDR